MSAELKAIMDKVKKAVEGIDSAKSQGYNSSTEVVENGRRVGNEETGGIVATERRSKRVVADDFADDTVGGKRGETARVDNGESTKGTEANITEGGGNKPWDRQKIVDREGRVSKEADNAYLRAVKSGDLETAQKYIDNLAEIRFPKSVVRNTGGKLKKQTHGTPDQFDAFDSLSEMGNHFGTRTAAEERMRGEKSPRYIEA